MRQGRVYKNKNKVFCRLLVMLLGLAMFFTSETTSYAMQFQTDSLNNMAGTKGGGVAKKVTGADAKTTLRLKIGTTTDLTAKVYKLADVGYENGAYTSATWVEDVQGWLKKQAAYSDGAGGIKSAFATPNNLASASSTTWNEFYDNLLYKEEINIITVGYEKAGEAENVKLATVATQSVSSGDNKESIDFENLTIGMYAVMVTATSGQKYNPIVVNLVPERNGPGNDYYIKPVVEADLKAVQATITKKINGEDCSSVQVGDTVEFTIDITLPTLYTDRVTLSSNTQKDYSLYVDDLMSDCFDLADQTGDNIADKKDFTITYINGSNQESALSSDTITYYAICDNTYTKSGTEGTDYFAVSDANLDTYMYDVKTTAALNDASAAFIVKQSGTLYTIENPTTKTGADNKARKYYKIKLNVGAMKQYQKTNNMTLTGKIRIQYKATVNDKIEVSSENNTNEANIVFEGGKSTDIVRAYTYGVQIVKIKGETYNTEDVRYLSGAKFNLYKEVATYSKGASDQNFVFRKDIEKHTQESDAALGKTYAEMVQDINTNGTESTFYLYTYQVEQSVTIKSTGYTSTASEEIARVFKKVDVTEGYLDEAYIDDDGHIVSVADENGVLIKGLDDGCYILVEAKAPEGYNDLAEDILFEINQIPLEEAELTTNGSLSACYDMDDQMVESGIILLNVINYKGLTLPTTGGAGILLFIVFGIGIMMLAMVSIVIKQRKQNINDWM